MGGCSKSMFRKEFNEDDYLEANPDVAVAVNKGIFCSGQEHYQKYGKNEGRRLKELAGKNKGVRPFLNYYLPYVHLR